MPEAQHLRIGACGYLPSHAPPGAQMDAHVAKLVDMGFDPRAATAALHDHGAQFEEALSFLMANPCAPPRRPASPDRLASPPSMPAHRSWPALLRCHGAYSGAMVGP